MKDDDLAPGIDIGGTNTSLWFVDREGILVRESLPTRSEDSAEIFAAKAKAQL